MKIVRGAVFSYRHPERSRGIFFVCRVPFPVWNGLHETPFLGGAGSRVFPACRSSHILCLAANEKDFSLSLEMTNAGKRYFRIVSLLHEESVRRYSPSFPWKEVPQRGGGWLSQRTESCAGERHSRIVIPSGAEGSFSFAVFLFLCGTVCMKHRFWGRREYGVSRLPFLSHPLPCRERKRFLAFARNDECGEAAFSYRKPSV